MSLHPSRYRKNKPREKPFQGCTEKCMHYGGGLVMKSYFRSGPKICNTCHNHGCALQLGCATQWLKKYAVNTRADSAHHQQWAIPRTTSRTQSKVNMKNVHYHKHKGFMLWVLLHVSCPQHYTLPATTTSHKLELFWWLQHRDHR